jgi:hypothetical protein
VAPANFPGRGLHRGQVRPQGRRIDSTFAYVGTLAMFEQAGFQRVLKTSARSAGLYRWLVRLELTPGSS